MTPVQIVVIIAGAILGTGGLSSIIAIVAGRNGARSEIATQESERHRNEEQRERERRAWWEAEREYAIRLATERATTIRGLEKLIRAHIKWDQIVIDCLREHGIEVPPPPALDLD